MAQAHKLGDGTRRFNPGHEAHIPNHWAARPRQSVKEGLGRKEAGQSLPRPSVPMLSPVQPQSLGGVWLREEPRWLPTGLGLPLPRGPHRARWVGDVGASSPVLLIYKQGYFFLCSCRRKPWRLLGKGGAGGGGPRARSQPQIPPAISEQLDDPEIKTS